MENEDGTGTVVEIGFDAAAQAPARKSAAAGRRKPASRAPRRCPRAGVQGRRHLLRGRDPLDHGRRHGRARRDRGGLGPGRHAVRRAVGTASKASRKTVTRLANEWKSMDPKKKAGVLAALLGAAAAASAPLVRKSLKK